MSHHQNVGKTTDWADKTSADIGADGSGAIAIKLVHRDGTWTIIADIIRIIFSICLLLFSMISVFYAISTGGTTMPGMPHWAQYICLFFSLFVLGVMEGIQISIVELAHKDPKKYERLHPRAAKLVALENKGRNVERFLMGRQVLVVFTVFIAARLTTFDHFWADVPEAMIHSLMFSGFLGVVLVVVVAQLTPQVLAAAYPVEFLNLFGMNIGFWACIIVESTGLVHAVWFLCVAVRKIVYNCVCAKGEGDDNDFKKLSSKSTISPIANYHTGDVDEEMLKTAKKAEIGIEKTTELAEMNKRAEYIYNSEYAASDDAVDDQIQTLLSNVSENHDLFYIYGDDKYMSPQQCYEKFTKAGFNAPQFLLPPDNSNHVPPHIVAMKLLKMYTDKLKQIN